MTDRSHTRCLVRRVPVHSDKEDLVLEFPSLTSYTHTLLEASKNDSCYPKPWFLNLSPTL